MQVPVPQFSQTHTGIYAIAVNSEELNKRHHNIAIKWQQRHLLLEMKIIQNGAHKMGYLIKMHFLLHWNLCVSEVLYQNWILSITQLQKWISFLVLLFEYILWWKTSLAKKLIFEPLIAVKEWLSQVGKNIFNYINNILLQNTKVGTIGNVVLVFYYWQIGKV